MAIQTLLLLGDDLYKKGQVSFEALFLTLIILSSAMYITNLYLQTNDATVATIIARTDLLAQINSFDEPITLSIVRVIASNNNGFLSAEILVRTNPKTLTELNFDSDMLDETKNSIMETTRFQSVTFNINPA